MSDEVKVVLAHPYAGHPVGAVITVDEERGRQLVHAAAGRYAPDDDEGSIENAAAAAAYIEDTYSDETGDDDLPVDPPVAADDDATEHSWTKPFGS